MLVKSVIILRICFRLALILYCILLCVFFFLSYSSSFGWMSHEKKEIKENKMQLTKQMNNFIGTRWRWSWYFVFFFVLVVVNFPSLYPLFFSLFLWCWVNIRLKISVPYPLNHEICVLYYLYDEDMIKKERWLGFIWLEIKKDTQKCTQKNLFTLDIQLKLWFTLRSH